MIKPDGAIGLYWGEFVSNIFAKTHLQCEEWFAWEGGHGFETCLVLDHTVLAFGSDAYVLFIKLENSLEGIQFLFKDPIEDTEKLREAILKKFDLPLSTEENLYFKWGSGEVIRFSSEKGGRSCQLMVAGPRFGKVYTAFIASKGLRNFSSGLHPK